MRLMRKLLYGGYRKRKDFLIDFYSFPQPDVSLKELSYFNCSYLEAAFIFLFRVYGWEIYWSSSSMLRVIAVFNLPISANFELVAHHPAIVQ